MWCFKIHPRGGDGKMKKLVLPPASGICVKCLDSKNVALNQFLIAVYCFHNSTGGVMPIINGAPKGQWILWTPIKAEDFRALILEMEQRSNEMAKLFRSEC